MPDLRVSFPKPCDEPWEAMTPAGCDRICERCARTIHDLRYYTIDEVEALTHSDPDTCVRASVAADGTVALRRGGARRMIVAIGATVGLLAASAPATADNRPPTGAIEGRINYIDGPTSVLAESADGIVYRAKVHRDGRYRIEHLPAGKYRLTFFPSCGESWALKVEVTVSDAPVVLPISPAEGGCITIGKLRLDDDRG